MYTDMGDYYTMPMANRETDSMGGNQPGPEWSKALTVQAGEGRHWRSYFHHETMPRKWQAAMIACAAQGMSEMETMVNMQVTEPCWLRWKENSQEFQELITLCRNISQAWFDKTARENLSNPYFKEKLWAMIVTARFDDPMNLHGGSKRGSGKDVFPKEMKNIKAPINEERLDHLFNGGDGFPGEIGTKVS